MWFGFSNIDFKKVIRKENNKKKSERKIRKSFKSIVSTPTNSK